MQHFSSTMYIYHLATLYNANRKSLGTTLIQLLKSVMYFSSSRVLLLDLRYLKNVCVKFHEEINFNLQQGVQQPRHCTQKCQAIQIMYQIQVKMLGTFLYEYNGLLRLTYVLQQTCHSQHASVKNIKR